MTSILNLLILLFLLCQLTVAGARTITIASRIQDDFPGTDDGICKLMVESQGYICEEHTVITTDGYILSLQRIPRGLSNDSIGDRPPVLLQHGVLMDGVTWLLNLPSQALAFVLADNGFDVWISNSRGTNYSHEHTTLSLDDPAYWDWSWDQLVAYDLPAIVEYVFTQSRQKLHYVGHSQGTLIVLAAFSQQQLLDMVRSAALLSPVAYLSRMTSPLARKAVENFMSENSCFIGQESINLFLVGETTFCTTCIRGCQAIETVREAVMNLLNDICAKQGIDCTNLLTSFTGENCCLSRSTVPAFLQHEPQPTSTKNMIHLAQMARDGTIAMYDYIDKDMNMEHYGQPVPPLYDLVNIPNDLPLFISHGGRDELADVDDVKFLLDTLKDHDPRKLFLQFIEDYAHADFVMAMNAKEVVYDSLISFFKNQT